MYQGAILPQSLALSSAHLFFAFKRSSREGLVGAHVSVSGWCWCEALLRAEQRCTQQQAGSLLLTCCCAHPLKPSFGALFYPASPCRMSFWIADVPVQRHVGVVPAPGSGASPTEANADTDLATAPTDGNAGRCRRSSQATGNHTVKQKPPATLYAVF